MIRFLDILISILVLITLLPVLLIIALIILIESKGSPIYMQTRVGLKNRNFGLFKFRTMYQNSHKTGLLTVGLKDRRITKSGYFLRRYKLDELLQFINVLKGDMCIVGPRPEVREYVDLYTEEQKKVLSIKPGITDYASIKYRKENKLLEGKVNAEEYYIKQIMPDKIRLNLYLINRLKTTIYFKIIGLTLKSVIKDAEFNIPSLILRNESNMVV